MKTKNKIAFAVCFTIFAAVFLWGGFQVIKYYATMQRIGVAACARYALSNALLEPCSFSIFKKQIYLTISSGDAAFICNIVEQTNKSVDPAINNLWNRYRNGTWQVVYDGANKTEHCAL